jgi:predicted transcriptional regulator
MDNVKSLELEILIVVRQNRSVSIHDFYKLFELRWKFYNSKFNELVTEGLLETVTIAGLPVYELTSKGKVRITDLIGQRERDVTIQLLVLKQKRHVTARAWKSAMASLHSIFHAGLPHKKLQANRR